MEDVRKYLDLPRVIVLMASNIRQLETTVEQHFLWDKLADRFLAGYEEARRLYRG